MCVCVCVCMYESLCMCVCVCVYVCVCISMRNSQRKSNNELGATKAPGRCMRACVYVCVCVCVRVCVCVFVHWHLPCQPWPFCAPWGVYVGTLVVSLCPVCVFARRCVLEL